MFQMSTKTNTGSAKRTWWRRQWGNVVRDDEVRPAGQHAAGGEDLTSPDRMADMLEMAWTIIANADVRTIEERDDEWGAAARKWRDNYHAWLAAWVTPPPALRQWGVRTTYTDGSVGTDWTNRDDAESFLNHYAEADANPGMRVRVRELVMRRILAGDVEVVASGYAQLRSDTEKRRSGPRKQY